MTTRKTFTRLLSVLLLVCMLVSLAPAAYAEDTEPAGEVEPASVENTTEPTEPLESTVPEMPTAPGSSSRNVSNELFTIQCDTCADHKWVVNWFGTHVTYVKDSMTYDADRGCWVATAKFSAFSLINSTVTKKNYFGNMTHYYQNGQSITINLYWDPNKTGLNSQKEEVTGLWLPDGEFVAHVWCYDKPAAPSTASVEKLDAKFIWVHENKSFPDGAKAGNKYISSRKLIANTYTLGEMYEKDGEFYCDLTITDLAPYVKKFADQFGESWHMDTINSPAEYKYVLKYTGSKTNYKQDGTGWTVQYENNSEKLNGKHLWMTDKYFVIYTDGVDGEELFADQKSVVTYGEATPAFEGTPARENYNFMGWNPEVAETVTADVTYTAVWEGEKHELSFDSKGGSAVEPVEVTYGEKLGELPTPTREGYSFDGWVDEDGNLVTADTVYTVADDSELTAQWTPVEYTVTVDPGNGEDPYEITITYEDTVGEKVEEPVREGYTFGGWVDQDGNPVDADAAYNQGIESLTAVWTANTYTLIFDANDGTAEPESKTVTYDQPIGDLAKATRKGYSFDGWYYADGTKASAEDVFKAAGDVTVTAKWTVNTYTIRFDPNGGKVDVTEKQVIFGEKVGELPIPTKEGCTFAGWSDRDGNLYQANTIYSIDGDVALFACWIDPSVNPKTGDDANAWLYAALMLGSLAAAAYVTMQLKKRKEN